MRTPVTQAIEQLKSVLSQTRLNGISTNLDYAHSVISDERFAQMQIWTRLLDDFDYVPNVIEVLQAGTQSSIQDFPGRVGYWDIGVPPFRSIWMTMLFNWPIEL